MKRVKGVEDLNIRTIGAQGIVGVGATIRTYTASFPVAVFRRMASAGFPVSRSSFDLTGSRSVSDNCSSNI